MPVYSQVVITFEDDFVIFDTLTVYTSTPFNYLATWVATRSGAGEVTEGTPTGTAGETAAINYLAAFDLDNVSGYTTSQLTNTVTLQSETLGEDFTNVTAEVPSKISVVFTNYDQTPVTPVNTALALTTSPYYINTPFNFDTTSKVTIALKIWDGDLTTVPSTATETLTKIRPTINYAEFNTDVSNIIRAYLDEAPPYNIASPTQIVDSATDNAKWVTYTATYTDATATISDETGTFIATDGYGYYSEGVNPTSPASSVLTSSTYRKVDRASFILFPFINNGDITSIDIDSDGGQINATETPSSTNLSTQYIQYVSVDVSQATTDDYITIVTAPGGDTFTYEIVDECKFDSYKIVFKNKYGVFDTIDMFKKSKTTLNTSSEEFVNNYISAGVYDATKHQFQKINITATESITLNSGYIKESENELYKQLLVSDKVFFYNGGYIPVNVASNSLEYKTRVNDSLVKYTIDFDYAYNTINNV